MMSIPPILKTKLSSYYSKEAEKGDAEATFLLAACYGTGFGVEMDKNRMMELCIQAAERGYVDAMKNIASMCEIDVTNKTIVGIPRDIVVVFPWLLKAAESGHPKARLHLC